MSVSRQQLCKVGTTHERDMYSILWQVAGQSLTLESLFLLIREVLQKVPPGDALVL